MRRETAETDRVCAIVTANGILTVSAIDKGTGKSESIVITK
jgi:molecular chaperone DnaK (HSP70)